jgi:hypothetical protein
MVYFLPIIAAVLCMAAAVYLTLERHGIDAR